jgi:hypothetical protein
MHCPLVASQTVPVAHGWQLQLAMQIPSSQT